MKNNIKVIIGTVIGIAIGAVVSGIGVYATLTYSAGDIAYTKSGSSTPISVSSALNELYQNKKETTDDVKNVTANGNIILDKYYKNLNVNVPIPAGYAQVSGTKTITTKANNIDVSNYQYADTSGMYTAAEYTAKTGEGEHWKKGSFTVKAGSNTVNVGFRPTEVYMFEHSTSNTDYISLNYLSDNVCKCLYNNYNGLAYDDSPSYFSFTSNGFRYDVESNFVDIGWKFDWVAIK